MFAPDDAEKLVESAGFTLNFLKRTWPNKDDLKGRKGGYLSLAPHSGEILFTKKVCVVRIEKVEKYTALASEKVTRLARHPAHDLSFQSRNPEKNEWGGAVRGHEYLWGFSGLTELLDEILCIGLALCKDYLTWDETYRLLLKHHPTLGIEFVDSFKAMSETDFEYGHIL